MTEILYSQEGNLGRIQLHRPKALNALSSTLMCKITDLLLTWRDDPKVKAVVIEKSGGKVFCAGGDIREVHAMQHKSDPEDKLSLLRVEYRLIALIADYPKPIITLMDGLTFGAGMGIALHSSHPVVTENTLFAMPEVNIGLFPDAGIDRLLAQLPDTFGIYLGMTAARLTANNMLHLGLAKYSCRSIEIPEKISRLATMTVFDLPSLEALFIPPPEMTAEPAFSPKEIHMLAEIFSLPTAQEIFFTLEGRTEPFLQQAHAALLSASPLSLCLTRILLNLAPLDVHATLQRNWDLAQHCIVQGDFYEGVRALLVDKDRTPKWRFPLAEIDEQQMFEHFSRPLLKPIDWY